MANFLGPLIGGAAGAAGGFAEGGVPGAILAGLGGLFGGGQQPHPSVAQRRALASQQQIANQLQQYGQSTPLSNQADLNSLAQALGVLGQQQRGALGGLAASGNILTPTGSMPDLLAGLQAQNTAQRMTVNQQHLADAVAARRQALLDASNIYQNIASGPDSGKGTAAATAQPGGFGATLADLAEAWAKQAAINKANQEKQTATGLTTELGRATRGTPSNQQLLLQGRLPTGGGVEDTDQSGFYGAYGAANPYALYSQPLNPALGGTAGAGDAPQQLDPMVVALQVLLHIIQTMGQQPKPKRKTRGAGDAPVMPLPGYGVAAGPMMPMMQQANRQQGAAAPGNEPLGGTNTIANQMRQPASAMLDRLRMGTSGLAFPL